MSDGVEPTIQDVVREKAVDGRITCPVLRKAAEDLGIPYQEAGAAADEADVKIVNCALGCF